MQSGRIRGQPIILWNTCPTKQTLNFNAYFQQQLSNQQKQIMNTHPGITNDSKKGILILTVILLFAAVICLIVNYSIDHMLSWSLYPVGALMVVWATLAPLMIMKKYRVLGLFSGLTITLIPFLFLIQYLSPVKGWIISLALPLAFLFLSVLGLSMLAFAYIKNKWYAIAAAIFLFGVVANVGAGKIVNRFLDHNNFEDIPGIYALAASALLTLLFIVAGFVGPGKAKR